LAVPLVPFSALLEATAMMLLPPPPDACPICAVKHDAQQPHNAQSLYYLYRFYGIRGRWPTWADAVAHCDDRTRTLWQDKLQSINAWTEPDDGQPIADPPAESINQPIGDIDARGFGPEHDHTLSD
jgi:hypothetical protein